MPSGLGCLPAFASSGAGARNETKRKDLPTSSRREIPAIQFFGLTRTSRYLGGAAMAAGGGAAGRSSPGRPAAYRLYRIHLEIKSGKCPNTRELAQALEVSSRTIERDIAYLRDMFQAPLHFDPKRRGYIYTEPSFEIPPLELQEGEVAALAVAARLLAQDLQTPIAPVAERALQRLIALLPGKVMIAPNQLEAALSFAPNTGAAAAELVRERFDQLMTAILNEKTVDSVYWSASRQEDT